MNKKYNFWNSLKKEEIQQLEEINNNNNETFDFNDLKLEISFDEKTNYYDAVILDKWIATQWKSLDSVVKNIWEAFKIN